MEVQKFTNQDKIVLTGDRPTGPLHLGHWVGSLKSRLVLQEQYKQFVMIADMQALTDNFERSSQIKQNVYQLVSDYLAVGIDPSKTTIFVQSKIPALSELTMYFMNLVNLGRLERNPTVKDEIEKRFKREVPVGFLCYPISQTSDIAAFGASVVPVGQDQLPILEQANEIIKRFNRIYDTPLLKEIEPYLSKVTKLVGIDGKGKAGKSDGNAISLSDDAETVRRKVFSMYTDPGHVKISDPGKVEGNVVFSYLDAFHPNQEVVQDLKEHYARGGLADTHIKGVLNEVLQEFLLEIRANRERISLEKVKEIIDHGSKVAASVAEDTLARVKEVMGINY